MVRRYLQKAMEDRADREIELGKYQEFNSVELLLAELHSPNYTFCPLCGLIFYPETASSLHCNENS